MVEKNNPFLVKVEASINHICDELKLTSFVRAKCIEMSGETKQRESTSVPAANGLACAIVSTVHEDARKKGRVEQHLPDRMIGSVYGIDSGTVVHNKHMMNSKS